MKGLKTWILNVSLPFFDMIISPIKLFKYFRWIKETGRFKGFEFPYLICPPSTSNINSFDQKGFLNAEGCMMIIRNRNVLQVKIQWGLFWDEVVLLKIVLSNFRPKQANEWIGDPRGSIIKLFIAILTWTNLTGSERPLSLFFHPQTLSGDPPWMLSIFWILKNWNKK